MNRRVVITGIGLCGPVGYGVQECWANLAAGRSGIGPVTLFDASRFPVRIAGQFQTRRPLPMPPPSPDADRKLWLGRLAATQAVQDAGLLGALDWADALISIGVSLEFFPLERLVPLAGATSLRGELVRRYAAGQWTTRLQEPLDGLGDDLARLLLPPGSRPRGLSTNCSACAAGAQAIGEAFWRLREGDAELALAGAADSSLHPLGLGGFSLLQILSTENDEPARACRPFDATRRGTVLAEGAAFVVLETAERAQARGASVYAELLGYGSSLDAYRVSDPHPDGRGAVLSMTRALADAGLAASAVDAVNAHGTGTPKNDVVETRAIERVLGRRAREIPVHAVKSMTGHSIAASGAIEAAVAALTLHHRLVPPTINLEHPDPECDLDYVPRHSRPFEGTTVLSNSFGFGGQNATLLLGRAPESAVRRSSNDEQRGAA